MEGQTSQRFKQIFDRKARLMIKQMNSLPVNPAYHPCFFLGSNHQVILQDEEVDLVITSPPYFNKDVEYLQLQIQRPSLNKSKRSYVIANILGIDPISKTELCGGKGDSYWNTNLNSLKEIFRVLKPSKLSFFWIGFKSIKYFEKFLNQLENLGFEVQGVIDVTLSNDRTASSRSTHHGKATGMMSQDHLIITRKING